MSAKAQLEKEIREAYTFLREKNNTIPSETLQFMLDASLDKLKELNDPRQCNWVCNSCGSHEYTDSVSEEDLENWLQYSSCGEDEFHKEPITN